MTPRPKNPPPDRRQEILDAALQVFAQKGYATATNAEIARAAGVTPAALYYYFPSKEELFKAALTERRGAILPAVEQLNGALMDSPPQVVLPALIQKFSAFFADERTQAILRIVLAEGPRNPEVASLYREETINQLIHFVLGYLSHQMERGTIRPMPPQMLVLLLAGPLMATLITRDLLQFPFMKEITNEALLQQLGETVLPALFNEMPPKE